MIKARINEIFHSLQGEGRYTGHSAVFVRFSGCNLRCPFCDTEHQKGEMMTQEEIVAEVGRYVAPLIVLTGGEPSLFVDADFVSALHSIGCKVAIETNGTHSLPDNIDWITCSPKDSYDTSAPLLLKCANEVKVVYDGEHDVDRYISLIQAEHYYLQPCDTGNAERNREIRRSCVEHILKNPKWALSLQTHKILDIR